MNSKKLSYDEKKYLVELARKCIVDRLEGQITEKIHINDLSPILAKMGASFVTLTKNGQLRGCIGTLEAYQSLVEDVCEHAVSAAIEDYRFPPVTVEEISRIEIEISCLTAPEKLEYFDSKDLINKIRPYEDGVVLRDGSRRATFLPQVWDQLPGKEDFLSHLCTKMGAPHGLWKTKHLDVYIYNVESFSEKDFK